MTTSISPQRLAARAKSVADHIRTENEHDVDGVLASYGPSIIFDDASAGMKFVGSEQVRASYAGLFQGFPDLSIEVKKEYISAETTILEVELSGTHQGEWLGIPPTGKQIRFPLCAIFFFDDNDKLTSEKVYYDRVTVLTQLGIMPAAPAPAH